MLADNAGKCLLKAEVQRMTSSWNQAGPVGLLGMEAFHFLFVKNRLPPPWPVLSSKIANFTVANHGSEGMERQRRSSQETIVKPWSRVLIPLNNIIKLFIEVKFSTNGRCFSQRRPPKARLEELEKQIKRLPETRLEEYRPFTHPNLINTHHPWAIAIKFLTKSSQDRTQVFKSRSLLCPPLPGKEIKPFFFLIHPKLYLWDLI